MSSISSINNDSIEKVNKYVLGLPIDYITKIYKMINIILNNFKNEKVTIKMIGEHVKTMVNGLSKYNELIILMGYSYIFIKNKKIKKDDKKQDNVADQIIYVINKFFKESVDFVKSSNKIKQNNNILLLHYAF